jgi:iron complex transport system ATP-binding protein
LSAKQRAQLISYLPQEAPLSGLWSVREVVEQGLSPHRYSLKALTLARHELKWICDALDLHTLWHRPISSLSGGERRRALIARTLCQNTKIVLLDEPLASLDWPTQEHLMSVLKSVCQRREALMIISLHELNLASLYTDVSLLLARGELIQRDHTSQVLTQAQLAQAFGASPLMVNHPHSERTQHLPRSPDLK